MKRTILLYGLSMAALIMLLKVVEYRFFIFGDLGVEFFVGFIALLFTSLGIWVGWKLTHRPAIVHDPNFLPDVSMLESLGISKREHQVLELIAQGLSNREIAEKLFLSPHTVKSHSSSLFIKLNARRRTEAIKKAKELRILG
ncbi:MAG: helix-turn-helix transcriptional regulator [Bacteroidetes bacterium]|nr:helix-turn-helix transcriptional regulator [Bacteroidota bacterium]